jgi:hypothetical protein
MSEDGATQGVQAGDALKVILGGQSEDDQVHMYPGEFESTIRNAPGPPWEGDEAYSECSNYLARLILEWLEKDFERVLSPVESEYVWPKDENGETIWDSTRVVKPILGWSDRMKEDGYFAEPDGMFGCTGFMWGWAVNAARSIVNVPSVPNPAIITIGGNDN